MRETMRVLCLHGFGESAASMRARVGPLAASLTDVDFVVPPSDEPWWRASSLLWPTYVGWETTLASMQELIAQRGPFSGVLGFSQGGCLAALLCATKPDWFRFAVIVGGFKSRDARHASLFERRIGLPSLHVIGEQDFVVLRLMGHWLAKHNFAAGQTHRHPGGHDLPQDVSAIAEFIREQQIGCKPKR